MEEYRGNRNATGRMQDAHWILMMEDSKVLPLKVLYSQTTLIRRYFYSIK